MLVYLHPFHRNEYYDNQDLDWLVLISNNITNVRDQWPLSDNELYNYAVEKYGVEGLSQVAYHETTEVIIRLLVAGNNLECHLPRRN